MATNRYKENSAQGYQSLMNQNYANMEFVKPGFVLGTVGSLISAGGAGKSFKALQDSLCIAIGRNYKLGAVLYLPAEDPIDELGKRLQAISLAFELTEEEKKKADENLKIWPLLGHSPDLLEKEDDVYPLVEAICNIATTFNNPLRLIVFDTLRRFSFADENDGGQMSHVLAVMESLCKRLGCSCLFLHHASKSAALNGQMAMQQAARGSSVLTDNIRYQEYLSVMTPETADKLGEVEKNGSVKAAIGAGNKGKYVEWGISKQNYGSPVTPQWLKRNENGVLLPVELDSMKKANGRKNEF